MTETTSLSEKDARSIADGAREPIMERIERAIGRTLSDAEWDDVAEQLTSGLQSTLIELGIPVAS